MQDEEPTLPAVDARGSEPAGDAASGVRAHSDGRLSGVAGTSRSGSADSLLAWSASGGREPELGDRLGVYRLERLLGQGGFGMVYLAEQLEPVRREVALKVLKAGMDSAQVLARFAMEQQTLASLDHPGVARIFDAGMTPAGVPYFAMELVRGEAITQYCERQRLSVRRRLELFARVCDAVQYAHQRGIIHRDLKPSNVLASTVDGVATAKIIDFGVAKAVGDGREGAETIQGQILGTPEYMSPEQAEMGSVRVDTRSDIYSLGVLLYELLTGERPIDGKTLREGGTASLRRLLREADPPKPSTRVLRPPANARRGDRHDLSRRLRGDLDWITMRAMEKDRERRYPSASELAADIRRHLEGLPVLAGPPSLRYRAGKFVARHRAGVLLSVAGVLAGSAFLGALAYQSLEHRLSLERKNVELTNLNDSLEGANASLARLNEELDARARELGETNELLRRATDRAERAREAAEIAGNEAIEQRRMAEAAAREEARLRRRAEHVAYANEISRAADALASGDARAFVGAMTRGEALGGGWETGALWAAFDASTLAIDLSPLGVRASALLPVAGEGARQMMLIGDDQGRLREMDLSSGRVVREIGSAGSSIARIALSGASPVAATLSRDARIHVWDLRVGALLSEQTIPTGVPSAIALSADGRLLAIGDASGRVSVRDAVGGDPVVTRRCHETGVQTLAFSPDDRRIISCSHDRDLTRISTPTWEVRPATQRLDAIARAIAFDGDVVMTGDERGGLVAWDLETLRVIASARASDAPVLALSARDGLIAEGSADLTLRVWSLERGVTDGEARSLVLQGSLLGHTAPIREARWGRAGELSLRTIDDAGVVRTWDLPSTGRDRVSPRLSPSPITHLGATLDGSLVVSAGRDGTVRAWEATTLLTPAGASTLDLGAAPSGLAASAELMYLLDARGVLRAWDPHDGSVRATRLLDRPRACAIAARARDGMLMLGREDGSLLALRGDTLETIASIDAHEARVGAIAISADGSRAVSISDALDAIVWDLGSFQRVATLGAIGSRPISAAISPDGRTIAVGDEGGFIHVHGESGEGSGTRRHDPTHLGPSAPVSALAFNGGGDRLVSCDRAGVVVLWSPTQADAIATITRAGVPIEDARFDPMDDRLLLARADGRCEVWRAMGDRAPPAPGDRVGEVGPNAAVLDAYCVSVAGTRVVPRAGEPFSIAVRFATRDMQGRVVEIVREIGGQEDVSRASAGEDEVSIASAWVVPRPGVYEARVRVRDALDARPGDDEFTLRFRVADE